MKIFISWGGNTALQLAIAFKENILDYFPGVTDTFISRDNIQIGELWFNEITKNLDGVEEGLVILARRFFYRRR